VADRLLPALLPAGFDFADKRAVANAEIVRCVIASTIVSTGVNGPVQAPRPIDVNSGDDAADAHGPARARNWSISDHQSTKAASVVLLITDR
jgi:hypothetical protein